MVRDGDSRVKDAFGSDNVSEQQVIDFVDNQFETSGRFNDSLQRYQDVTERAADAGTVVVVAAGNDQRELRRFAGGDVDGPAVDRRRRAALEHGVRHVIGKRATFYAGNVRRPDLGPESGPRGAALLAVRVSRVRLKRVQRWRRRPRHLQLRGSPGRLPGPHSAVPRRGRVL